MIRETPIAFLFKCDLMRIGWKRCLDGFEIKRHDEKIKIEE